MSRKEDEKDIMMEESAMIPPESVGDEPQMKTEEQEAREAIKAIRKFTDEDDDDEFGEISVKSILGGDFLMSRFIIRQIMFVMFCVVLMILYTGNRYDSQQDVILIDSLRGRLQEVKYNVLTQSSELMNLSRQSNVEKMLVGTPDSLLHNSIIPPFLIKAGDDRRSFLERKVEEVLVDSTEKQPEPQSEDEDETGAEAIKTEQE